MVSIILNLSYIPDFVVEKFRFETGFHKKFKPAMLQFRAGQEQLLKMAGVKKPNTNSAPKPAEKSGSTPGGQPKLMSAMTKKFGADE